MKSMSEKMILTIPLTFGFLVLLGYQVLYVISLKRPVPRNVSDIYNRRMFQRLVKCQIQLGWYRAAVTTGVWLLALLYVWLDLRILFYQGLQATLAERIGSAALVAFCFLVYSKISKIPLFIRKRYGLIRHEIRLFEITDVLNFILSGLIYFTTISLLLRVAPTDGSGNFGSWFWIAAGIVVFLAARRVIRRVRFKRSLQPLPEGRLRLRLRGLLRANRRSDVRIRTVLYDAGKMFAFMTGFPGREMIVLSETLLGNLTEEEVCAVVLHELGHVQTNAICRETMEKLVCAGGFLLAGFLIFGPGSTTVLFQSNPTGFPICLTLYMLAITAALILRNLHRNREEYRADSHAAKAGYGKELISALKALEKQDFGLPNPVLLFHLTSSGHPPLSQRIENIEAQMRASI